jgi:hypothetical protein
MASWEVLLPLFTFVLVDGGTPILFWGFIVNTFGMLTVYASHAEMTSMSVYCCALSSMEPATDELAGVRQAVASKH